MIKWGICVCLMYLYLCLDIITCEIMVLTYFHICNSRYYHVFLDHSVFILSIHLLWIDTIMYEIMVPIVIKS